MITTKVKLTGERPHEGVTPDSLLALHDAGYRAVADRVDAGRVLDIGCGQGFESARLANRGRPVVGVDFDAGATTAAAGLHAAGLSVARMDALALGLATASFDAVCSSHLIEHFVDPANHVAEVARVLRPSGSAFFLTPNAPADFENPFHVHLFGRLELVAFLSRWFGDVWLGGLEALDHVKADLAARRAKAQHLLALDIFDLRHKVPRQWYVAAYSSLLPLAYRLVARRDTGGATGITADDWFVSDAVDDSTPVLFAVCRRPLASATPGPEVDR